MKLHVLSDLHLGFCGFDPPRIDADVVILAGDIARPRDAIAWARRFDKPVLYVLGNHEFYGSSLEEAASELRRQSAGTCIHVLDNTELVLGQVRFLGTTLWTDFELFGDGEVRDAAMAEAQSLMRDFSRIRISEADSRVFSPDDAAALFERDARWLDARLDTKHDGPTVVITHHAPSRHSVHPRFAKSLLTASFVSDAQRLLGGARTQLWIHGHTHDSFDYVVNGTRVVCNPRGYAREGVNENPRFDPDLVIDLDRATGRELAV
ncbi:MAG: metallophosphoesterase [Burkholderiales bacterium]|nr:metallophosphoesterase [Burkholderiales bacterium]